MAAVVAITSCAFLLNAPARSPQARTSYVPRAAVQRQRVPVPTLFQGDPFVDNGIVPFEDEPAQHLESSLSTSELTALLVQRGVRIPSGATRSELVNLLLTSLPSSSPAGLAPLEAERVNVFERVSPSVAYIRIVQGDTTAGAGSGFVWDSDGHIITNYHVVAGATGAAGGAMGRPGWLGGQQRKVTVSLPGFDEPVEARVVGTEPDKDIAVLKVSPAALSLKPLEVGSSADLRVGQSVLAIGNPFGLDWTLTTGIVSALGRDITGAGGRPIKDCVQTDAAINPGNSGGPLLDSRGRLIGVNTMIFSPGGLGANVGIGFAVPADVVKRVVNQIITLGPNARPSLGVGVLPDALRAQYARSLNRKLEGAIIAEVVPGSPADELKLSPCARQRGGTLLGDMIISANGTVVRQNEDLLCAIEECEPDQPISLTVMRGCDPERVEELEIRPVARKNLAQ